jgi:hypothetical protein
MIAATMSQSDDDTEATSTTRQLQISIDLEAKNQGNATSIATIEQGSNFVLAKKMKRSAQQQQTKKYTPTSEQRTQDM